MIARITEKQFSGLSSKKGRPQPRKMPNAGEESLAMQLRTFDFYFVREHKFHPERKWKFDFAFPSRKLAVEIEGGVHTGGRHTTPTGFIKDMEKYNAAAALGWRIMRYTPQQVQSGAPVHEIIALLK